MLCPVLPMQLKPCLMEDCALWIKYNNCCAIVDIAQSLDAIHYDLMQGEVDVKVDRHKEDKQQ